MRYTNAQMDQMLQSLEPFLDRADVIGYAAARNTRLLHTELSEYLERKLKLLQEYGEEESVDGAPTGRVCIKAGMPGFGEFVESLSAFGEIAHEPELFTLPYEEAIGKLTGAELLALDWMFEDRDKPGE